MINKPFFSPPRRAQGGQNLPPPSGNMMNLGGFNVEALAAALRACGFTGDATGAASQAAMQSPQRCRRTLMGLPKILVPASSPGVTGSVNPQQYPFRGLRLIVPTEISASGDLVSLKVGVEEQLAANTPGQGTVAGGVPLRTFDQTAHDCGFIDMDWANPTTAVNYTISNKFAAPYTFEGSLEGVQLL